MCKVEVLMNIFAKIVQAVKTQNHAKTYFCATCPKKCQPKPERCCNFVRLIEEMMIYLAATSISVFYGILFYNSIKLRKSGDEPTVPVTNR